MKTRFVKAAVLMLAVSLLAIAVSFTVGAAETPTSEFSANWSLSASAQTVTLDGKTPQTVMVALVTTKAGVYCDGIAGGWEYNARLSGEKSGFITMVMDEENSGLVIDEAVIKNGNTDATLNTQQYAYPTTGEFMWVNSIREPIRAFSANFPIVTATYKIDPNTPSGNYVINFTKTVYAGETTLDETEETLSIVIKVNGHTCTPGEWKSNNQKHWKECTVCEKELTEFTMDHIGGTANCQSGAICTGCGHAYTDKDLTKHTAATYVIGETTHWQKCTACGTEKIDGSEHAHEYTLIGNTQCICGAVKHICAINLTAHAAVAPTCKTGGNIAYWSCTCGSFYSDAAATSPIAEDSWILAVDPNNHESTEVTYTDNGETHSATYNCCGGAYVTNEDHDFINGDCICGAVKPATGLKGDVDLDGDIDMDDFTLVARHVGEVEFITDSVPFGNADVNDDGAVDMDDFTIIARHVGEVEFIVNSK